MGTVARLGVATVSDTLTLSAALNSGLIRSAVRPVLAGFRQKQPHSPKTMTLNALKRFDPQSCDGPHALVTATSNSTSWSGVAGRNASSNATTALCVCW